MVDEQAKPGFLSFYRDNEARFNELEEMLEDDFSRETLRAVLHYRLKPRPGMLKKVAIGSRYFVEDILEPLEDEVFIDGGAYIGDTVKNLYSWMENKKWKKVYCWEPDETNLRKLVDNCRDYKDVVVIPYGMWSEKAELRFKMDGDAGSQISENGKNVIPVKSIDNICAAERVTFIKMDIEGSEQEALRGAEKVIRRDKPRLAICIYHKPEDLIEIPMLIRQMVPDYKLYIRHHSHYYNETVVYASL